MADTMMVMTATTAVPGQIGADGKSCPSSLPPLRIDIVTGLSSQP